MPRHGVEQRLGSRRPVTAAGPEGARCHGRSIEPPDRTPSGFQDGREPVPRRGCSGEHLFGEVDAECRLEAVVELDHREAVQAEVDGEVAGQRDRWRAPLVDFCRHRGHLVQQEVDIGSPAGPDAPSGHLDPAAHCLFARRTTMRTILRPQLPPWKGIWSRIARPVSGDAGAGPCQTRNGYRDLCFLTTKSGREVHGDGIHPTFDVKRAPDNSLEQGVFFHRLGARYPATGACRPRTATLRQLHGLSQLSRQDPTARRVG